MVSIAVERNQQQQPEQQNNMQQGQELAALGQVAARATAAQEVEDDRRSVRSTSTVASTVATTASLASRLAALTMDFNDKLQEGPYEDSILEGNESGFDESDEEGDGQEDAGNRSVGAGSTDRLVEVESPDHRPPPFQVCSRLFIFRGIHPIQVKRMGIMQVEELKQNGYTVVDNFISRDAAAQIKALALAQFRKGRMVEGSKAAASGFPADMVHPERVQRADHAMWLAMGRPPADSSPVAQLMVAFQELYDDLHEFVRLKRSSGEYQINYLPPGNVGIGRHRDALPDAGRGDVQRRITCVVCCNSDWEKEQGGNWRIWPPRRSPGPAGSSRRSLTGSDAGTSAVSEDRSDTFSLRSHYIGTMGGAASTTSSMWAEMSLAEHDAASVDFSIAESAEPREDRAGLEWIECDNEMVLDIAPLGGRLLVFLAGAVDHAQVACSSDNVAVSAWFQ